MELMSMHVSSEHAPIIYDHTRFIHDSYMIIHDSYMIIHDSYMIILRSLYEITGLMGGPAPHKHQNPTY